MLWGCEPVVEGEGVWECLNVMLGVGGADEGEPPDAEGGAKASARSTLTSVAISGKTEVVIEKLLSNKVYKGIQRIDKA